MNAASVDSQRIAALLEAAYKAMATGRAAEGARLYRQAESEAPHHPLVLNEFARRLLHEGKAEQARDILTDALGADPSHASLWINLAAALRTLGLHAEEMSALEKVLELNPNDLRALLQKASLEELRGRTRDAAATYRVALGAIPTGASLPAAMLPILKHAKEVVDKNARALEEFLGHRIRALRERHAHEPLARFDRCFDILLQKRKVYRPQPSFMNYPGLPAIEFYERPDFPWLAEIEAATEDIRNELLAVLADGPATLEPYVDHQGSIQADQWRELNRSRRWGVYSLWREGIEFPEHIARCPRTVQALRVWPRYQVPRCGPTALFSILDAHTRIPAHSGVSNTRLIVHLPLVVPPGCGFRVGAEQREWVPGKALVFDDTFEHEAWNDSDTPRAVLIIDIWSPFLSVAERELVTEVTAGVGEYYGASSYAGA
jgi:aspartyl/asparaginyl beta-hydroxylase (cupin superfamily)